MDQIEAYNEICRLAREHALILSAFGGFVTIVHPNTQKEEGLWERIQYMHMRGDHPKTIDERQYELQREKIAGESK